MDSFRYELSMSMVQLNSLSVAKEMRSVMELTILSLVNLFLCLLGINLFWFW